MRKGAFSLLLTLLAITAMPLEARSKHQSYITYDAGSTVLRQGEDDREIAARVNMPVYPGDELSTSRRGRTEVRLADGNVIALNGSSSLVFRSILDSYEGESSQTVAELLYGEAIVHRVGERATTIRLDTESGSYVSSADSVFLVETDGRGRDLVQVLDGSVQVRTPERTSRLRAGEQAKLDDQGIYSLVTFARHSTGEFSNWYMGRAERSGRSSQYLDRNLGYASSDLDNHGSWVYVNDYSSWVWRPRVASGWRPYHHGSWARSRRGTLTWVSDEPWGWVPYHYGRWAFSLGHGWVWLPGSGYSPAWVYWVYGPSYVGWIPAGWYDCYRPYYDWAYRPYSRVGVGIGFGFYGRIRLNGNDLRGWTFVSPDRLISNRTDRAALTADLMRDRLKRDGSTATLSNAPLQLRRGADRGDPSSAIQALARGIVPRGDNSGTAAELPDATRFFNRESDIPTTVKNRIARGSESGRGAENKSVEPSRLAGGNIGPGRGRVDGGIISRGDSPAVARSAERGTERETVTPRGDRRVDRGSSDRPAQPADSGNWRRGVVSRPDAAPVPERGSSEGPSRIVRERIDVPKPEPSEEPEAPSRGSIGWRERSARDSATPSGGSPTPVDREEVDEDSVPRRIIDRIGGSRVTVGDDAPRSRGASRSSREAAAPRPDAERPSANRSSNEKSSKSDEAPAKKSDKSDKREVVRRNPSEP